jgi:transposase
VLRAHLNFAELARGPLHHASERQNAEEAGVSRPTLRAETLRTSYESGTTVDERRRRWSVVRHGPQSAAPSQNRHAHLLAARKTAGASRLAFAPRTKNTGRLRLNRSGFGRDSIVSEDRVMARPSQYPLELRRRAVRMVAEVRPEYDTEWAAMKAVAQKLGIGTTETLRKWVRQDQIDAGTRAGTTSEESAELKRLKKENAELKRANDILKAAAPFFAAELDQPHALVGVTRSHHAMPAPSSSTIWPGAGSQPWQFHDQSVKSASSPYGRWSPASCSVSPALLPRRHS